MLDNKRSVLGGIRCYKQRRDYTKFWYAACGLLFLLILSFWLTSCATSPTYETIFYRTMDVYNQTADLAFAFAARPETTVEQKRTIVRILWVGEDVIDAVDEGEKTMREAIKVLTECANKLQEVMK